MTRAGQAWLPRPSHAEGWAQSGAERSGASSRRERRERLLNKPIRLRFLGGQVPKPEAGCAWWEEDREPCSWVCVGVWGLLEVGQGKLVPDGEPWGGQVGRDREPSPLPGRGSLDGRPRCDRLPQPSSA